MMERVSYKYKLIMGWSALHTPALIQLSLEKFYQPEGQQQKQPTAIPSNEASLPVNYGRKPISEEEITLINVRCLLVCISLLFLSYSWVELVDRKSNLYTTSVFVKYYNVII